MQLFRTWLFLLGLGSLATALFGLSFVGSGREGSNAMALIVAGSTSAIWCFGFNSVVGAIQRIEEKLGMTPGKPEAREAGEVARRLASGSSYLAQFPRASKGSAKSRFQRASARRVHL
jgi:hypothetical protein